MDLNLTQLLKLAVKVLLYKLYSNATVTSYKIYIFFLIVYCINYTVDMS